MISKLILSLLVFLILSSCTSSYNDSNKEAEDTAMTIQDLYDNLDNLLEVEKMQDKSILDIGNNSLQSTLTQLSFWKNYFNQRDLEIKSFDSDSLISPYFYRDLIVDGEKIRIDYFDGAPSGVATCEGSERVIYFAKAPTIYTDLFKYAFFREHEFAHHQLKHINCPLKNYKHKEAFEFEADSLAAKNLLKFGGSQGQNIIYMVVGTFSGMEDGNTYSPPLRERAVKLLVHLGFISNKVYKNVSLRQQIYLDIENMYNRSKSFEEFSIQFNESLTGWKTLDIFDQE